jgi:uncharacterized protein
MIAMRTLEFSTVEDAIAHGYGRLADPNDLYLSPRWLKLEQELGVAREAFHVLCVPEPDSSCPLAAAWGFHVDEAFWWPFVRTDLTLARLAGDRLAPDAGQPGATLRSLLPNIYVGAYRGGTSALRVQPGLGEETASRAIGEVIDAIEATARARGIRSTTFLYLSPGDRLVRQVLLDHGYLAIGPVHNVAVFQVRGQTFEDYLRGFGKRRRDSIKWERRKIAAAGVKVGVEELSPQLSEEMFPLESQLYSKYGHPHYPASFNRRLHAGVRREYGPDAWAITARSAGTLRGYASFLRVNEILYSRDTGYDYTWRGDLPLYFELLFYSAIELAMQSGIREIHYAYGSEQTKASRGCELLPRLGYVKAFDEQTADELRRFRAVLPTAGSEPE